MIVEGTQKKFVEGSPKYFLKNIILLKSHLTSFLFLFCFFKEEMIRMFDPIILECYSSTLDIKSFLKIFCLVRLYLLSWKNLYCYYLVCVINLSKAVCQYNILPLKKYFWLLLSFTYCYQMSQA